MWRNGVGQVGRWAPWLLWSVVIAAAVAMVGLAWRNRELVEPWESAVGALSVLAYATPGALIVARRRGNRIGWLFLGVATLLAAQMLSAQYAIFSLRVAFRFTPLAVAAAWIQNWTSIFVFWLVSLFVVLYPDGRLYSRRWLLPLAGASLFWLILLMGSMFAPGPITFYPVWAGEDVLLLARNPLARPATLAPMAPLGDWSWFGGFSLFLVAMTAPLFRYWRSGLVVRQQLRWLMFLAVTIVVGFIVVIVTEGAGISVPLIVDPRFIMMLGFPLAVSVAILRHNLYDLDLVINRTLVYGALTGALALVYFSTVVLLQLVLPERTELATVISTLAVAALFSPLRQRIQGWIDRRFYRHKYDAARALAGFAASARDEVDLDKLVGELVTVVQETVQPDRVGVWVRPG